ncbi:MAG: YceI family protein [Aestuariibacter sp.]
MQKYLFLFLFVSYQTVADWHVNNANSAIHFLSTKQSHITEIHTVQSFSGSLQSDGTFSLNIDLASVETGIEIRNKRMREWLFDLSNHRFAKLEGQLTQSLSAINPGMVMEFEGTLTLNGKQQKVDGKARIAALDNNGLVVSLTSPLLIQTNQFDLVAGIEKLREIAGLKSISYVVPVTATLFLDKQ